MSMRSFGKYEGAGNDFILIDDRMGTFPVSDRDFIVRLCHRKFGIGADGFILLQSSDRADFRMRIFNSDGSEPEGCLNGLRCLILFLADLGLPQTAHRIEMGDRVIKAERLGSRIALQIGLPRSLVLYQNIGPWHVHSVDTGVPHAVIFVPNVQAIDLMKEAPLLRHHPLFHPRGTNVNFATLQSNGSIHVRTFERGVEGETLACGTGAAAVACIGAKIYSLPSPIAIHFPGGMIEVSLDASGIALTGEARKVFGGTFPHSKTVA
jgi:diaminopimelate epimerase